MSGFPDKTADEILADLKAMVEEFGNAASMRNLGTVTFTIPHDHWYRLMWLGDWPDLPPALDMWRFDLVATDPVDAHAHPDAARRDPDPAS